MGIESDDCNLGPHDYTTENDRGLEQNTLRNNKTNKTFVETSIQYQLKDTFWMSNILSPRKLREKFDTLYMKSEGMEKTSYNKTNYSNKPKNYSNQINTPRVSELPGFTEL